MLANVQVMMMMVVADGRWRRRANQTVRPGTSRGAIIVGACIIASAILLFDAGRRDLACLSVPLLAMLGSPILEPDLNPRLR